jgi:hypothetical protein
MAVRLHRLTGTVALAAAGAVAQAAAPDTGAYQPRFADAPPARVGQAGRGGASEARVAVMAPEQKAASATPTPRLYWYLSADSDLAVEIVLQERDADRPLLEQRLQRAGTAGMRAVDLAAANVTLRPGVEYVWSVALVTDPGKRASDLFAMGAVEYVVPAARMPTESPVSVDGVRDLLSQGYWYDAIDSLEQARTSPTASTTLIQLRQDLFRSQQLPETP